MAAFIQTMDSGIIITFKVCYLHHTFYHLLVATDDEDKLSIWEYWHGYNILKAIDNVAKA
jgi:hypothetical protein